MAIKVIQWSPDTCECVLEYEYDTEDTKTNKTFTGRNVISACPRHSGAASPNATFGQVLADNNVKNNTLRAIMDNFPALTEVRDPDNPEDGVRLKSGAVSYVLRLDRVYELTIPDLTQAEKDQAQSIINSEVGDKDKVVIL